MKNLRNFVTNLIKRIKDIHKKGWIIIGVTAAVIAAVVVAVVFAANKKSTEPDVFVPVETLPVETEQNAIVALSEDGPMFPSLEIAMPTEEPIPEYLREGVQHPVVIELQQRLMDLGYMDFDEPTDYYGPGTQAAVIKYQRQNELAQDGILSHETLAKIMSEDATHYQVKEGDSGDDIIILQQRLYQLGYLATSDMITGNFGEKTKEAVLKLQERNGITQDGTVGLQTYNLIYSDEVKANMLAYGEKSEVVLAAQKRLFNLGYMTSQPDGTYGEDTSVAIRLFQRKNALVVDGYLGPDTRALLMSDQALPNGLSIGDENEQVTKVQQLLAKWGYLNKSKVTGYYGELTVGAVENFQKTNGLTVDGKVGAKTLAKLTSDKVKKPAAGSTGKKSTTTTTTQTTTQHTDAGSTTQTTGGSSTPNTDASGVSGGVSTMLSVARSKLGCPYVWGAKGPNSFDCSGFVYWVLNQCGVSQSYISSAGWRNIGRYTRISNYSDLRAGDILVVSGHVAIVSTGGCIIDASSSNGRVIERGLGSWWANHFIVGWRIF